MLVCPGLSAGQAHTVLDIFACSGDVQFLLANGAAESSVPLAVSDTCGTLLFRQGQHLWHSAVQAVRGTRGHLSTIGSDAGRWLAQPVGVPGVQGPFCIRRHHLQHRRMTGTGCSHMGRLLALQYAADICRQRDQVCFQ